MKQFLKRLLLVALLCVPWVTQAQTDTLTVADGTTTNSFIPVYGLYVDEAQHNQIVYPTSMLAELMGDSITGMAFYMSSTASGNWNTTVTIKLGITSLSDLSSGLDATTSLTQVWQGTMTGQDDTIWIPFTTAIAYMGGNLLVDITTTAATYKSASFYGTDVSNASRYSYGSYTNNVQNFIPKTSFLHVDGDFEVCLMPTNLNVVASPYSATFSWTAPEGVSDFAVTLNGQPVDNVSNPMTLDNLVPGTSYNVSVSSICASGDTSYASTTSFLTPCVAFAAPYTDNFDANSSLSVCYGLLSYYDSYGTIYPYISTGTSHSGNRSLYFYTYSTENFVVAPSVDLAGNNMHVSFWGNGSGQLIAGVVTNRNDMSTFIALDTAQGDPDGRWLEYDFYTDAVTADTAYVAFKLSYSSFYLDDLTIEASTSCRRPMAAVIDSADTVSVSMHWIPAVSGSATYEIGYAPVYDLSELTIVSDITDTFAVVTGLTPNVYNFFWVRTICGDDTTHWTYAGSARTDCSPDGMVAPYVEDFMGYGNVNVPNCWNVLLSTVSYSTIYPYVYSGTSYGYLVMYPQYEEPNLIVAPKMRLPVNEIAVEFSYEGSYSGTANFELGYVTNPNADSTFVALDTVVVSGSNRHEYEFNTGSVSVTDVDSLWIAFRASVAGSSQYAYVYIYGLTIKHLSNCQRPSMVSLDTVGHDMAILSWDSVAENYEILVSTTNNVNDPNATTIQVSGSNTGVVDNLLPSTKYYTWVRSDCGDEQSEWRIGPSFVTRCGENYCLVSVRAVDSYQYAGYYNAINVYVDGTLRDVINYSNYQSYNINAQYDVCDGDTLTLTYYPYGSSYNYDDYVTVTVTDGSGAQVFNGTCGSYADGDTIVRLTKPCPTCMPVASVAVDDEMSDATSLTAYWVPNAAHSGEQVEYVLSLNGVEVATVADTFYTFYNLTAETSYTIGVATKCSDDDTAMFVYSTALTDCEGGSCNVAVYMHDSYGDGWNGAQLSVVQNGITKGSFTISSGNSLTANVKACQGDSLQLFWTAGSYDSEASFEVIGLGGDTLFNSASVSLATGLLATTDTVICPACISPNAVNVSNITTTGADVSWNANGIADSWVVTVSNNGTLVSSETVNTPSYQITGLTPATFYTVGVASICGGDTAVATTATFATLCSDITLPWYFNAMSDPSAMSNTMPLCWFAPETFVYASYYGDETYPYNTTYSGITVQSLGTGTCMAATPRIPAPANNLYIRANLDMYEDAGTTMQIGFISNPAQPSTFIPFQTLSAGTGEYEFITTGVAGIPADSLHIAFRVSTTSSSDYYGGNISIGDIYVQVAPACQRPDSVTFSNITTTTATIGWTNTGANHYLVTVNDTVYSSTTNSVNVTGLAAGTTYAVAIQGICSDSSIVRYAEFTTACDAITLPFFTDFENDVNYRLPNCWTSYNNYPDYDGHLTPYVYDYSYYAHSGSKSLYFYGPSNKKVMAVSGALTGAPINQLYVNFWANASSYGFEAGLMTDPNDTTTFIKLLEHSGASYGDPMYSMYHYEFNTDTVTSTATTYYFAIRLINAQSYAGGIYVDDISVSLMPDCSEEFRTVTVPGGTIDGESAMVEWTVGPGINNGATYTVTVLNANNTVVTTISDAVSPQAVNGLNAETPYRVVVSLNCGGQVTAVSDTVDFTTRCAGAITASSYSSDMSSTTTSYAPVGYSTYNYSYVQTIIDSAQLATLNDGNGNPASITTFAFLPLTVTEGSAQFNGMYVYMANVSESDLASGFIMPDANHHFDTVLSNGNFNFTEAEWQYHNFDTAFTWDGHSNVLFAVNRVNGTWKSTPSFSAHQTSAAKTRYLYNDNNAYDISTVSDGTTLNLVGDLMFLACGVGCAEPTALVATVNDYQSATITWNADADTVEYAFKNVTDANYPAATRVANNGTFAVTGLTPATEYMFHVRAICEDDGASDWVEVSFTTAELPCFDPENLVVTDTGYSTVTLAWDADESQNQWSVKVWNNNFDPEYTATGAATYTVTGLAANTSYYAAVKALCGNGIVESGYSDTVQFTTNACGRVTGVTTSGVTAHSVVVSWNDSGVSKYKLEYGDRNFSEGNGTTVVVENATSYTITGLLDDHNYSVFVKAVCEEGVEGQWSELVHFTTETEGIEEVTAASQLSIYPNPATDVTTIAVSGVNGEVSITIVDMNGRVVAAETVSCEGDCTKSVEVSGLAQGAYFVRVNGENLSVVRKLIVK